MQACKAFSWNFLLVFLLREIFWGTVASEKVLLGADFEPLQKDGHVAGSMAVVLYDESVLSPFHKTFREFDFGLAKISIKQDWKGVGIAAVVWDAAVSLADFLSQNSVVVKGKKVLELGAGTGLAGIVAGKLGGDIILTDRKQCLGVLEENLAQNTEPNIRIRELTWGQALSDELAQPFDVILGADIIYIEESFPSLLKTLRDVSDCDTQILLAQKIRYERDEKFLKLLAEDFTVGELEYKQDTDVHIYSVFKKC